MFHDCGCFTPCSAARCLATFLWTRRLGQQSAEGGGYLTAWLPTVGAPAHGTLTAAVNGSPAVANHFVASHGLLEGTLKRTWGCAVAALAHTAGWYVQLAHMNTGKPAGID